MRASSSYRGSRRRRKLVARLSRFQLPEDTPGAPPPRAAGAPEDLPAVDFVAERFTWRGKQLGRVEVPRSAQAGTGASTSSPMANADAQRSPAAGTWRSGGPSRTALEFEPSAGDAGGSSSAWATPTC